MCKNHIAEKWYTYEQTVMPKNAGDVQRQETKRAFYGGVQALFVLLLRSLGTEEEPTLQELHVVADVESELKAFYRAVKKGDL